MNRSHLLDLLALALLGAMACGDDSSPSGSTPTDELAVACADPGTPTVATPAPDSSPTGVNVTAEACTRTARTLACSLGVTHQYTATTEGGLRTLVSNGIPDHDVGDFPNPGNPNTIAPQTHRYQVPVTPSGAGQPLVRLFGILTSGAPLDPATAETWNDDPTWRYEALRYATAPPYFTAPDGSDTTAHPTALGVDCNLAHVQPGGTYHYHGVPYGLLPSTPAVTHVGWAADGYPIVALYDHQDRQDPTSPATVMRASWQLKTAPRPDAPAGPGGTPDGTFGQDWEYQAGSGDLDECNGREGVIVVEGQPVSTYHYVLTSTFPFIPRCWHATPDASFTRMPEGPGAQGGGGQGGSSQGGAGSGQAGGGQAGSPPAVGACAPGQTSQCCGDGVCDGPETKASCAADCG